MMKIWTTLLNGRLEMRSAAFPALIALLAALGAAHILVRTSTYGAALGNDAFNYLSAAESLAAGEGLLSPGGGQMTLYAPFFSMAMAFLSLFGIEPVDGGRFLNATAFGLLIPGVGPLSEPASRVAAARAGRGGGGDGIPPPLSCRFDPDERTPLHPVHPPRPDAAGVVPEPEKRHAGPRAFRGIRRAGRTDAVHRSYSYHLRSPHAPFAPETPRYASG